MKPENRFIKSVHDVLNPDIEREKMFNPMRGGTADCNYAGWFDELWVEYKWKKSIKNGVDVSPRPKGGEGRLSSLQRNWLLKRHDRNRAPWVVVGSPEGCVILREPKQWAARVTGLPVISKHQLAREIELRCGLESSAERLSPRGISTR